MNPPLLSYMHPTSEVTSDPAMFMGLGVPEKIILDGYQNWGKIRSAIARIQYELRISIRKEVNSSPGQSLTWLLARNVELAMMKPIIEKLKTNQNRVGSESFIRLYISLEHCIRIRIATMEGSKHDEIGKHSIL